MCVCEREREREMGSVCVVVHGFTQMVECDVLTGGLSQTDSRLEAQTLAPSADNRIRQPLRMRSSSSYETQGF